MFVHLHLHTEYSVVNGIIGVDALLDKTAALQMSAVAVTDQVNLFALVKFYRAAINAGIKPIVGAEILLANEQDPQSPSRLVLLCKNYAGYKNLTQLISQAYLEGQATGKPIVQFQWLKEKSADLIALSGGMAGDVGQALLAKNINLAQQRLLIWRELFADRFYLELQRTGRRGEDDYLRRVLPLAEELQIPVVATNDVQFLQPDDFEVHEARVCIHDGTLLNDPKRAHLYSKQQYLRSPEEMSKLFADIPEAITNTVEIAKRCNVFLTLEKTFLPNFPVPKDQDLDKYFFIAAHEGLEKRLQILFPDAEQLPTKRKIYDDRLQSELKVISQMGFISYFLIVADFIRWAKINDIPVGPGRGSGAGSLVAYALGITDIDPLQYDLLFERFLNPERISMPDFDIDFCMDGRDRVIEYVMDKYGRQSVSQIITYGTMAARAVVRDVGRVLGYGYGFVDKIAKLIPHELGITLERALQQEEQLKQLYQQEEEIQYLINLALKLEGVTRNVGKHAGGVVISPTLLTDFSPLYCEPDGSNLVTQFDKDDVEVIGLVKFDFLGLRTLTIINWAVKNVNQRRQQINSESSLDISLIPLDDPKVYAILKACQTTAVFQLESRGMKDLMQRLQPDCFEEIIALVALFRPGPLQSGMVDDFINRKHGRARVEYLHDSLKSVLAPTYGVILYQEQVMQIAQVLSGYSLGSADILRRAMGKKKPEEMESQREIFVSGALARGVDVDTATHIFDLVEKFSGYGFNKSHSAAYALLAYQTAWLKTHYPAEFMAAVLSADMDNTDKVVIFIEDCEKLNLQILPPNINTSEFKFQVVGNTHASSMPHSNGAILFGLGALKGAGEAAIENIIAARQHGKFIDLFDFCRRVDLRKVNHRVLEVLIKSGAMDELGAHRLASLTMLDSAVLAAEQHTKNLERGQVDLFGEALPVEHLQPELIQVKPWNQQQILQAEKETLGVYLSGHPLDQYKNELLQIATDKIVNLTASGKTVIIAGFVVGLRVTQTKRGDKIAFVTVDDRSGRIDVAVFADIYQTYRDVIQKDQLIVIEGETSSSEYSNNTSVRLGAKRIFTLTQAREMYAKHLLIKIDGRQSQSHAQMIDHLLSLLNPYRNGKCKVVIEYLREGATALLPLGADWHISPADELLQNLQEKFKVMINY